jgi:hypothetical protein
MAHQTLHIAFDSTQACADLRLLADAAKRSIELRARIVGALESGEPLVGAVPKSGDAPGANTIRFRVDLSPPLRELVSTLRAGQASGLAF